MWSGFDLFYTVPLGDAGFGRDADTGLEFVWWHVGFCLARKVAPFDSGAADNLRIQTIWWVSMSQILPSGWIVR